MESYRIDWRRSARKELRRITPNAIRRILEAVEDLERDPFPTGCQKLSGSDCAFRIRVGDYRVIYEVFRDSLVVEVVRVRHRRDVYRQ